jgi:hypothetical protein
MSVNYIQLFNTHFMEFVNAIVDRFPEDLDLVTSKNFLELAKKSNPKMIIKVFYSFVIQKYATEIDAGNLDFFIHKDYSKDVSQMDNSDKINKAIDRLRNPIKLMNEEEQKKVMKYIQNLKKLSELYFQSASSSSSHSSAY